MDKYKEQFITLRIVYNSEDYDAPDSWDWNALIDSENDKHVVIVSSSEVYPASVDKDGDPI